MVLRDDILRKFQPSPHRAPPFSGFKRGRRLLIRSSPNDVPTRDGREQAPHLSLQRPVLSCCRGSDRGMIPVDRSKAHAEIGSPRTGVPGRNNRRGPVAQRIEQQPSKLKVAGSIPAGVARKINRLASPFLPVDTPADWRVDTFTPFSFPARIRVTYAGRGDSKSQSGRAPLCPNVDGVGANGRLHILRTHQ
jgi:hypothetical protein